MGIEWDETYENGAPPFLGAYYAALPPLLAETRKSPSITLIAVRLSIRESPPRSNDEGTISCQADV